jgi:hypothetical protein
VDGGILVVPDRQVRRRVRFDDTLTLASAGLLTVGLVGARGPKDAWLPLFRDKAIVLALDNDAAWAGGDGGRGASASSRMRALRVALLPEGTDVNPYCCAQRQLPASRPVSIRAAQPAAKPVGWSGVLASALPASEKNMISSCAPAGRIDELLPENWAACRAAPAPDRSSPDPALFPTWPASQRVRPSRWHPGMPESFLHSCPPSGPCPTVSGMKIRPDAFRGCREWVLT